MGSEIELNNAELEVLESKFNAFLNLTIAGAAKDYYNKEYLYRTREITILDDYDLDDGVRGKMEREASKFDSYDKFGPFSENYKLNIAFESLSDIEQMVIFLYFKKEYKPNEIAEMLKVKLQSVSRIKKRALDKIKKILEEMR